MSALDKLLENTQSQQPTNAIDKLSKNTIIQQSKQRKQTSALDKLFSSQSPGTKKETISKPLVKTAPIKKVGIKDVLHEIPSAIETMGKGIFNFFTNYSQKLGKTYGSAIATKNNKERHSIQKLANKQYTNYLKLAKQSKTKEEKRKYLSAAIKAVQDKGQDIFNDPIYKKTTKQILGESLGTVLDMVTFGSYGKGIESFKYIRKLPQVAKSFELKGLTNLSTAEKTKKILTNAAKESVKVGMPLGVGFGLSNSLIKNKKIKQNIEDTLAGGLAGTVLQFGLGAAAGTINEKLAQEKMAKIAENKSITNKIDKTIKYIFKPLGISGNGEKVLGRTEINYKNGEATVFLDPTLKKDPELLRDIIQHEHGHILDKRVNAGKNISAELPNYSDNKENLDIALEDFSKEQGKTVPQVAAELNYDIQRVGNGENNAEKFADAFSKFKKNPTVFKNEAPILSQYFEDVESHIVTEDKLIKSKLFKAKKETNLNSTKRKAIKSPLKEKTTNFAKKEITKESIFGGTNLKTNKVVETKSFNPKTINSPEEVQQLFNKIEGKLVNKNRLSKSNQDIKDLAHLVGLTDKELIKAKPGSIANAETITKARQLVIDKAQDLANYIKSIKVSTATNAQLKVLKDKWMKLVSMQRAVAGLRTEAANAFRSLGIELMPGENAEIEEIGNKLEKFQIASKGDLSLFSHKVGKDVKMTLKQKIGRRALSTWYASILSGPKTTVRNIVSTMGNIASEFLSKLANPKEWKEIVPSIRGMIEGFFKALPEAKETLKGKVKYTGKYMQSGGQNTILFASKHKSVELYGKIIDSVGRFLNAQDIVMKGMAAGMEKASLKAQKTNLDKALSKAIIDSYGEKSVYHGKPTGKIIRAITSSVKILRKNWEESKIIIPFVDTVANVIDRQFDYIPIFSQLRLRNSVLERQAEQIIKDYGLSVTDKKLIISRLRDQQIGRMFLGTAVTSGAVSLAMKEKISGTGPTSYTKKQQLEKSGWRANSIKIGNKWYPYINWGPIAGILSIAGNIHDKTVYDKSPTKTLSDLISKGIIGWMQTEMDTSFLSGISNVFGVLNGNYPADKYFKYLISGLVPIPALYTQTKDIYKYINGENYIYTTNSIQDKIQKKLLLNPDLPIKRDAFGRPMKFDLIWGISPSKAIKDPVIDFLNKNQIVIGLPYRHATYTIYKGLRREMTKDEYNEYIKRSGKDIYNLLKYKLPLLKAEPQEKAKDSIKKIVAKRRKYIRHQIINY